MSSKQRLAALAAVAGVVTVWLLAGSTAAVITAAFLLTAGLIAIRVIELMTPAAFERRDEPPLEQADLRTFELIVRGPAGRCFQRLAGRTLGCPQVAAWIEAAQRTSPGGAEYLDASRTPWRLVEQFLHTAARRRGHILSFRLRAHGALPAVRVTLFVIIVGGHTQVCVTRLRRDGEQRGGSWVRALLADWPNWRW